MSTDSKSNGYGLQIHLPEVRTRDKRDRRDSDGGSML